MPRSSPSRADTQLIQALAELGLTVSPYQLERWRAAELLPRNRRRGLGRGKGSVSELDGETVERATTLARVAGQGRELPGTHVLDRFVQGQPVAEEAVRAAYSKRLGRLCHLIGADAGEDDDGWQARYGAAKRLSRRSHLADAGGLLDAFLGRPERHTATNREERDAVRTFTQTLAHGGDAPLEDLAGALAVFGGAPGGNLEEAREALREAELSGSSIGDEIAQALSLNRFREVLDQTSFDDLRAAATVYSEACFYQSLIIMAGMWTLAAEANGTLETVAPGFRDIDRATVEELVGDPVFQSWGSHQDPFMRNRHDCLVLGSLGLIQLPDLLKSIKGYRDRLSVIHGRLHQGLIEAKDTGQRF